MAFKSSKEDRHGSHSNQFRANKFFKIVIEDRLKIPESFIKKWGQNLPNQVTLKAPRGSLRQVELVYSDGETWLDDGWQDFKDYYSIGFGHLLVFEYDGNSHFDVLIFDTTTMEIKYPLDNSIDDEGMNIHTVGSQIPKTEEFESESDDSPVILKDFRTGLKGKEKCKEVKGQLSKNRVSTIVDKESCIAYQRAKAFKSVNPFFVSLMQPSYLSPSAYLMIIPFTFVREHLSKKRNELRFQVPGKKTHIVWCTLGENRATLTTGWKEFVKENALKLGDACVFEVTNSDNCLWNVTIFRS